MIISKMNLLQAIGSIVSLVLYLFLPILGVSVLVPIGFTGETCMQLDFLFVIPVILLGITLIVSLLPIGPYNSIAGIATAIGLLVVGCVSKSVAASKVAQLLQMTGIDKITNISKEVSNLGLDSGSLGLDLNVSTYASLALKMSWGLTIPILIMLVTAVLGMIITVVFAVRAGISHTNAASSRYQMASTTGSLIRPSRPTPGTNTSSHRNRSTRYHR